MPTTNRAVPRATRVASNNCFMIVSISNVREVAFHDIELVRVHARVENELSGLLVSVERVDVLAPAFIPNYMEHMRLQEGGRDLRPSR